MRMHGDAIRRSAESDLRQNVERVGGPRVRREETTQAGSQTLLSATGSSSGEKCGSRTTGALGPVSKGVAARQYAQDSSTLWLSDFLSAWSGCAAIANCEHSTANAENSERKFFFIAD